MTTLYLVNNWFECYNVYLTREHAEKAIRLLKIRAGFEQNVNVQDDKMGTGFWITEIKEGEGFGPETSVDGKSDVFID